MKQGPRYHAYFVFALCLSIPLACFAENVQIKEFQSAALPKDPAFQRPESAVRDELSQERSRLVGQSDTAAQKNRLKLTEYTAELASAVAGVNARISEFGTEFDFSKRQFDALVKNLENLLKSKSLGQSSREEAGAFLKEMKDYQETLKNEQVRYLHDVMAYPDYLKQSIAILREHQQALENFRDFLIERRENPHEAREMFSVVLQDVKTPKIPKYEEPVNPLGLLRENSAKLKEMNKKLQAEAGAAVKTEVKTEIKK